MTCQTEPETYSCPVLTAHCECQTDQWDVSPVCVQTADCSTSTGTNVHVTDSSVQNDSQLCAVNVSSQTNQQSFINIECQTGFSDFYCDKTSQTCSLTSVEAYSQTDQKINVDMCCQTLREEYTHEKECQTTMEEFLHEQFCQTTMEEFTKDQECQTAQTQNMHEQESQTTPAEFTNEQECQTLLHMSSKFILEESTKCHQLISAHSLIQNLNAELKEYTSLTESLTSADSIQVRK